MERQIETIEKQGDGKEIWGIKSAKSFRDFLVNKKRFFSSRNREYEFVLTQMIMAYDYFNPIKVQVEIEGWHGKSSFEIVKGIDNLTIIKYQRKDRDSNPDQVRTEVSKAELQAMIDAILKLKDNQPIRTSQLSVIYSRLLGLEHSGWKKGDDPIFSDRSFHNKYTLILDALDELKLIKYSNGKVTILNNQLSIQQIL
jgi:hypothetical protein